MCLFGNIVNEQMRLNNAGLMIKKWWQKVGGKFPSVQTDKYVVMPNHFHGIIKIVGAAPRGRPIRDNINNASGQLHRIVPALGDILNWFKTMTTNKYIRRVKQNGWPPFHEKLWQRNYYEHIIRNEKELNHIRQYIAENPVNWRTDEENPNVMANP
jgi:REP element-mobilizing transposase RayT